MLTPKEGERLEVTEKMGCGVSTTVEGWQERLASREGQVQPFTRVQPSVLPQPPYRGRELSLQKTTLLVEGQDRHNPRFGAAVALPGTLPTIEEHPVSAQEGDPVHEGFFKPAHQTRTTTLSTLRQPSCSAKKRVLSVPETALVAEEEDRYKFFSILEVAPSKAIIDNDDGLPHIPFTRQTALWSATMFLVDHICRTPEQEI